MSQAMEDYICASEDRSHYDYDLYNAYDLYNVYDLYEMQPTSFNKPPVQESPAQQREMQHKNLKRQIEILLKDALMDLITDETNINIDVDMDYEKLRNKPTVDGMPLVGDLTKHLDNLKLDKLDEILREEGL